MLTATEIERYAADGYLPGRPLLTAEETALYRTGCERGCGPMKRDGTRKQSTNRVKPYLLFPWAAALVRHARILDCVEALIGPDIMVFHTTVWLKEPHSETFVPWHQDATYFGLAPFEHPGGLDVLPHDRKQSALLPGQRDRVVDRVLEEVA